MHPQSYMLCIEDQPLWLYGLWLCQKPVFYALQPPCNQSSMQSIEDQPHILKNMGLQRGWSYMHPPLQGGTQGG
jgi:hypothetical protein